MKNKNKLVLFIILIFLSISFFFIKGYIARKLTPEQSSSASVQFKKPQSDSAFAIFLDSAMQSSEALAEKLGGRKISIMITGVDARLGSGCVHADANHLVNIWLDSGKIEILSIPRGTFCDLGYADSCHINYLANVRYLRGRDKYIQAVKEITGIDTIHYFVEFGFSQAIGLMELLGFKDNAVQMLRVIRSRKAFGIGDYQRAYNQGQFIRQMILTKFNLTNGVLGDILLRTALYLTDNNLSLTEVNNILSKLKMKKFPHSPNDVIIRLVPKYSVKTADFNFTNKTEIDSLYKKINYSAQADSEVTDTKPYNTDKISKSATYKLQSSIKIAKGFLGKKPDQVIKTLSMPFSQKTWYQIGNLKMRDSLRDEIYSLLIAAYSKTGQNKKADEIKSIFEFEKRAGR